MADTAEILQRLSERNVCAHLLAKLKYAQNTARAALAAEFDKIGLTTPQFLALAGIDENADISSAELARQSFVTPQAMITIVARLESAGLISRSPSAGGGRSLTMRLTENGAAKLKLARAHAYAIERYILEQLGPQNYEVVLSSLDRMTDALAGAETVTKRAPWDAFVRDALDHPAAE